MTTATQSRLEVVPLTPHIGAEMRGLDMTQPLGDEDIAAINEAFLKHSVIVFRGQKLSQEDLLRVTSYFGPIGHMRRPPKYFPPGFDKILPNIMLISNIRENGPWRRYALRQRLCGLGHSGPSPEGQGRGQAGQAFL